MPDQKPGDAKREVKDMTRPSSDTNTETTRSPGVPAPQKGGPDKSADTQKQ
jgi:hypothetical protein